MSYTMADFKREMNKKYFDKLSPDEQQEVLRSLPLERLFGVVSTEQLQQYLDEQYAGRPPKARKPRRKK